MTLLRLSAPPVLLRAALLLALFAPGCSGDSAAQSQFAESQKVAQGFAELVAAAGGSAKLEGRSLIPGKVEGSGWFIDLSGDTVTDELIDAIIEKRKAEMVFDLNFSGSTISDDQLAKLDAGNVLDYLFILNLSNTQITDAGLDKCTHLHALSELKAAGSKITKEGAERLSERKLKDPKTHSLMKRKPKIEL